MTPAEAKIRFTTDLPITLARRQVFRLTYRTQSGGRSFREVLGVLDSEELAGKIAAELPDVIELDAINYVSLTNPDEADPKVPVYLKKLSFVDEVGAIEPIDSVLSAQFAALSTDQFAELVARFTPRLAGSVEAGAAEA